MPQRFWIPCGPGGHDRSLRQVCCVQSAVWFRLDALVHQRRTCMISMGSDKGVAEGSTSPVGRSGRAEQALHEGDRYYARGRLRWLRKCLDDLGERPAAML